MRCCVSQFWQAKLWGLLHDPLLKGLYADKASEGHWQNLVDPFKPSGYCKQADWIAAASDRPAWDRAGTYGAVNYQARGLEVSHLLSGNKLQLDFAHVRAASTEQDKTLGDREREAIEQFKRNYPEATPQETFWWAWRCLPVELAKTYGEQLALLPADTRIPDCSVWSHNSLTAAIAGSLQGYDDEPNSRPQLGIFSFTPVQELIKASRKMQDFWAGSWLLHYLSAKVCWTWAQQYGPDSLVYPSLFAQPLIDHWLLQTWPHFQTWIAKPTPRQLLTAGFPNVLTLVLPSSRIDAAMQTAGQVLNQGWLEVGDEVWDHLGKKQGVNRDRLWKGWLKKQWQTYWTALPLGDRGSELKKGQGKIVASTASSPGYNLPELKQEFVEWVNAQNYACNVPTLPEQAIASNQSWQDLETSQHVRPTLAELSTYETLNVGLWWSPTFDRLRYSLAAVKLPRTWELPTVFTPRSTISGIGPVLHPHSDATPGDWVSEAETQAFWGKTRGWFDGSEQLNASEVLKRGLQRTLPKLLKVERENISPAYPDLCVGVAGWLRQLEQDDREQDIDRYSDICETLRQKFMPSDTENSQAWGIPWVDDTYGDIMPHPRVLNAKWGKEDLDDPEQEKQFREAIAQYFPPGSNPTDWYVLAAGDGDGMGEWLKGSKMKAYEDYTASEWPNASDEQAWPGAARFLKSPKRMGPATHAALSRALLDFSNQLVPYLTEQRYAGRLIYCGGDDVLAYTNLWEWERWLWDVRQCFRGAADPKGEFDNDGDYWRWKAEKTPESLAKRPLFTMGSEATISFGVVIAHHSVPLAIALETLWEAEAGAKDHQAPASADETATPDNRKPARKDAVQVRVLYGNGNQLQATSKFATYATWRSLVNAIPNLEPALFEQAAQMWEQHPIPSAAAIAPWTKAFCQRREALLDDTSAQFQQALARYLTHMWQTNTAGDRDRAIQSWLKLAAFSLRQRDIKMPH